MESQRGRPVADELRGGLARDRDATVSVPLLLTTSIRHARRSRGRDVATPVFTNTEHAPLYRQFLPSRLSPSPLATRSAHQLSSVQLIYSVARPTPGCHRSHRAKKPIEQAGQSEETEAMASDGSNQAGAKPKLKPPPLPLSVRLQLAELTAAIDAVERRDGTVNRCLYGVIDRLLSARANPRPDASGVRSYDVTMDASKGIWARVFAPATADRPLPVVVYFHGGGFALFSPAIGPFNGVCRHLCAALGAVVVSVNYRLAPEHQWPAAYDDGVESTPAAASRAWTATATCPSTSAAASWPGRARAATSCTTSPTAGRRRGRRPPGRSASWASSPCSPTSAAWSARCRSWRWRASRPWSTSGAPTSRGPRSSVGATRDHPAAHVTDDNADLAEQFPPAMVIIGDFDPLMDWQRRYADVLRRKGKEVLVAEYPGMFHGFYGFPELPEATKVLQDMKAFVDSHRATPKLADA